MGDVGGGTHRGTGVAGSGLNEQLLHLGPGDDFLVELDVQRAAAGESDLAGLLDDVAQIVVHHLQRQLLEQRLHGGGVMDVRVVGDIAFALGPEPVDQLGREVITLAVFLVAPETDDVGVVGVDGQLAVLEFGQTGEIVFGRVAIGRHAHDLELAVEHLEAEVFGDRTVQAAQRIRVVEFLDLVDLAVLTPAEEGSGVFALAVDTEDGGLLGETGAMVGTGGVGQMMLDRLQLDLLQVEAELLQAPLDTLLVAVVATVAHENGIQRAIRRVPVALGVVPASLLEDADGREGNRHHVDVGRLDAGLLQAELGRLVGHAILGMLVAHETLFFDGCDQFAVDVQSGGRIMTEGAGKAENRQCHRKASGTGNSARLSRNIGHDRGTRSLTKSGIIPTRLPRKYTTKRETSRRLRTAHGFRKVRVVADALQAGDEAPSRSASFAGILHDPWRRHGRSWHRCRAAEQHRGR